jgi:deazaflavin-dependent oxidoreductase (nitroreductase family)
VVSKRNLMFEQWKNSQKILTAKEMTLKLTVAIDRSIGRTIYRWHLHLYRLSRGFIGHKSPVGPMLILETTGRRSGLTRSVTLLYYEKGDRYFVVASNGGRPRHPEWLLNVRQHPEVWAQVGALRFEAFARAVPSTDDPAIWNELVTHYRGWGEYQKLTNRILSFVELAPTTPQM